MKKKVRFGFFVRRDSNTFFEGNNGVNHCSSVKHSYIGKGSYIGSRCHLSNVKVGRYCSIGDEVSVICGAHPVSEFISTHPAFYSTSNFSGLSFVVEDKFTEFKHTEKNYLITVENDVWIGSRVSILQGVTIGNGAVVAAGAVVVNDVEPFEVVGGVPAKKIKKRFSDEEIAILQSVKWWDWNENILKKREEMFASPKLFFDKYRIYYEKQK